MCIRDSYKKDVHWGASIRNSVVFWKPFLLDSKKYTHLEFVGTEYEPDKKRSDYNKAYNPSGDVYKRQHYEIIVMEQM